MLKGSVIFYLYAAIFYSCHKPCHEPDYSFSVTEEFVPEKDSINVGDTIWLLSNISKNLTSVNSPFQVNFSNAQNLGSNLIISDISNFQGERGAVASFSYFVDYGNIFTDPKLNPINVKQVSYIESDTAYLLKIALIAQKQGLYILPIPDVLGVYRKGSEHCGVGNFQILNSNGNKHLYLFETLWGPSSLYDSTHSYCLKVK